MLADAYLDESEDRERGLYCVAGYVFKRERHKALEPLWSQVLEEHGLPYFHMVDCAPGNNEYARFDKERRIVLQTRLMDLLKSHAECGVLVTMDLQLEEELRRTALHDQSAPSPHTLCAYGALHAVARWARKADADTDTHFFFEYGSSGQVQLNSLMDSLFKQSPMLRERMRYAGHTFIPKGAAAGVQCADILAWQGAKDRKCVMEGRNRRKDFQSLLECDTYMTHLDRSSAARMFKAMRKLTEQRAALARSIVGWVAKLHGENGPHELIAWKRPANARASG